MHFLQKNLSESLSDVCVFKCFYSYNKSETRIFFVLLSGALAKD